MERYACRIEVRYFSREAMWEFWSCLLACWVGLVRFHGVEGVKVTDDAMRFFEKFVGW